MLTHFIILWCWLWTALCKPYLSKARSRMQCTQNWFSSTSAESLEKSDDYQVFYVASGRRYAKGTFDFPFGLAVLLS